MKSRGYKGKIKFGVTFVINFISNNTFLMTLRAPTAFVRYGV